ncbi:MAG TPA: hypothetical protein VEC02_03205 [Nitrososphaerales archaeon]|nr:hypothetical protein [Nitrososphaerales archaeon]
MEFLEGEKLRRRLLECYSRNPRGWDFIMSPSQKSGFYDGVVAGPEGTWMLKIDSLFKPFPTVIGAPTEEAPKAPRTAFPFGFRKLPPHVILRLLGGAQVSGDERMASLVSVLSSETVVPEEGASYAQGPFVLTRPGKVDLSENQRELDDRLTSEMRRFLRLRYPAYG